MHPIGLPGHEDDAGPGPVGHGGSLPRRCHSPRKCWWLDTRFTKGVAETCGGPDRPSGRITLPVWSDRVARRRFV